jgi:hypothetical protein
MISIYDAPGSTTAFSGAVSHTTIAVQAPAQFGMTWLGYEISMDGATSTATPALVELCTCTFAGAGTNTAVTIVNTAGNRIATGFTAFTAFTAEPTVLAPFKSFFLPQYGGTGIVQFTPGQEPDSAVSVGYAIRITSSATVNSRCSMRFSRC